jgi:putative transposase
MARPLRIEFAGAVYHVSTRGNARQTVFIHEKDYSNFLHILGDVTERFNWCIYSYCLMSNHYHLIIETPDGNLSKGMRQLNGVYTQKVNYWHSRTGHLFQGRYKAIVVDKQNYLLEVCRYVVLNPVRASMVGAPEDWHWSSYRSMAGYSPPKKFLTEEWILKQFSDNKSEARRLFRDFVRAGITIKNIWKELRGNIILGDKQFAEEIMEKISAEELTSEIPKAQRYIDRQSLAEIFEQKHIDNDTLQSCVKKAYYNGYILKEIAEFLHVHYTTVSRLLKKGEKTRPDR